MEFDDKVMICFYYSRIKDSQGEPKRICQFFTSRFAEWLKMLTFAKKNEITMWPREDDENISKEILERNCGIGMCVDDVSITFGSKDSIPSIVQQPTTEVVGL